MNDAEFTDGAADEPAMERASGRVQSHEKPRPGERLGAGRGSSADETPRIPNVSAGPSTGELRVVVRVEPAGRGRTPDEGREHVEGSEPAGPAKPTKARGAAPEGPEESEPSVVVTTAVVPPADTRTNDAGSARQAEGAGASEAEPQVFPARMLNEFVYCPRLFYYEFVEGVFVESADTTRGSAIHQRVDSGNGAMPSPKARGKTERQKVAGAEQGAEESKQPDPPEEPETIHSRSVQMGSERLGVIAKMDLVESRPGTDDLFAPLEVCPVDYKAGAPRAGEDANELWDTDKMQLGLQALILRENGYTCDQGIIYYRATRQRVPLPITSELETWIRGQIAEARRVCTGAIPPPLVCSPKCVRCSLAPVCLPDETRALSQTAAAGSGSGQEASTASVTAGISEPRRLIAARDDTRALYLNTQGSRVGCSHEVLRVKEQEKLLSEVRIRDLSHVALFGNVQISTQAVQALCDQDVPVTYFSTGGWFYGLTRGHSLKNVFLRVEQFRLALDTATCLLLARRFVHGKIRNHRTLLMRNHLEPSAPVLLKLKRAADDALEAVSLGELLGIEGAAANQYFQEFSGMIKIGDDLGTDPEPQVQPPGQLAFNFDFNHRNRRPPTDPVNAMLSLGYSMLSKDCTLAALAVGFDPYIGFYHQPRFGRPALALDLMEEFRPLIAESTVLSCINNRVISDKDFVRAGQAVNLSAPGRKRFFQMYELRMSSLITHPLFEYKVSYRRALELQARLLAKTLTGEIPEYPPLLTR